MDNAGEAGRNHKQRSPIYERTIVSQPQGIIALALCGHWMQSRRPTKSDGQ